MKAVFERPAGSDLTVVSRMTLGKPGAAGRVREIVTYRRDVPSGDTFNLVRFLAPADIAGTGLLSVDRADGANDQWLYLPELDRVRRIASDRRNGRFVASDLYYEDLQKRQPGQDRHRSLGKAVLDGVPCEIIESVPLKPSSSSYRKRVSWIDPESLLALRIDYFEKEGSEEPTKRWLLSERKRIQGHWTVTDSRMIDLGSGHETRIVARSAVYDRKLPARLFTTQALEDEQLESEYRP